ncbi:MAG: Molybdenum cofactor guanylyltransferase [Alphaproteobacteria bacterium MarineAlpha2_Bin1]|nr:MAG: Molybdenum cofactor guanylyltransferase [Alphaproteobacteria bacterium MarineAlpha2_Bin1]
MNEIIGVILAGGKSSRFEGGDKIFAKIDGETLIHRAIRKASKQVDKLILSTNHHASNDFDFKIPIVPDMQFNSVGPLGGILSSLEWVVQNHRSVKNVVYFAADVPFFPDDIVDILINMKKLNIYKKLFCVSCEGMVQPLFSLWDVSLRDSLRDYLNNNNYKVETFFKERSCIIKELKKTNPPSFFNVNTYQDLEKLNSYI